MSQPSSSNVTRVGRLWRLENGRGGRRREKRGRVNLLGYMCLKGDRRFSEEYPPRHMTSPVPVGLPIRRGMVPHRSYDDDMFIRDSKQSSDHQFFLVAIFDICGQKTCVKIPGSMKSCGCSSRRGWLHPSISRDSTSICSPNQSG